MLYFCPDFSNQKKLEMKKTILLVALTAMFGVAANAQSTYKSAIGGRFGTTYYDVGSVSYKFFVTQPGAVELNFGVGSRGYSYVSDDFRTFYLHFSGAYQHHFNIPVDGLRWFVGGGAVVYNGFANDRYKEYRGVGVGLFPTGGIDYKFSKIPLNLTADVRPTFLVTAPDYYNSFEANVGVAIRYTIGQR